MSAADLDRRKTVRLTTRGRKSGQPRTATIWFVADGANRILVQHATSAPANWYQNLVHHPAVSIDFGDGPVSARATPLVDPQQIRQVLALVRRKYWSAWLIQLLGRKAKPVAAEIRWE